MNILVKKDIIIPAGTILKSAPIRTVRHGFHGEHVLGFGPDGTGFFTIDEESAQLNPDYFELTKGEK